MLCSPYPGFKSTEISEHLDSKEEELRHVIAVDLKESGGFSIPGSNEKNGKNQEQIKQLKSKQDVRIKKEN